MYKPITVTQKTMDALKARDLRLGAYIEATGPLSRSGIIDPYVALLDCIIAQQVSSAVATTLSNRFFARFPQGDPQAIVDSSLESMRELGLSRSKIGYIQGIAQIQLDQSIDFESLGQRSTQEIMEILLPIKGVGRWTVEMLLIFTYEKQDVMSFGDLAIRRGIERIYHLEECTKEIFDELYQRYAPYQSAASFYLWHASLHKENIPYNETTTIQV